uniref:Peroxiredoxin like 2A n=1 Tax=Rousettus aegyptiacus TaxID=9407 RepID=A0A7J8GFQ5_ROUAE|nr:peroxiredoxin like 2A [Rousettus aegyptiacus]
MGLCLVFLPLASSKGEGGREGSASRICCTQGFAKHMTSAKAGSASAQLKESQGFWMPGPAGGRNELRAIGGTLELRLQPAPAA